MDYLQKVFLEGASSPSNSVSNSSSHSSSKSPSTKDPLLTASAGEIVNNVENQMLHDYSVLGADGFINKYGIDTYKSLLQQTEQAMGAVRASRIANSGSLGDVAGDSVKNIITGALGGLTDTGAFVAGMTGMDTLAKGFSYASEGIRKVGDALGSDAEQAKRELYAFKQQGLKNRIDREYEEDIASGKSTTEAELARMGKQFGGSIGNAFSSGQALELGTSGFGSILTGGVVSKGISLGAKAAKAVMPKVASGVDAFAKSNKVAEKIVENSPWMASMGMQEGGGAYSQQLLEGLSMSIEDLRAHSPQFNTAVKHYVEQGYSLPEAEQKAKEDMAFAAAKQASLETAAAAFAANYLTAPLAKMARGDKLLSKYIGEALNEPIEEGITEGLGQIAGNKATRDYLDQRQELMEDVGQASAEGAVGGLGIVGARTIAQAPNILKESTSAGLSATLGLKEAYHDSKVTPEASLKNIETFTNNSEKLSEFIEDTSSKQEFKNISDRLNNYADKAFGTVDPETGKRSEDFNVNDATEVFFNASEDLDNLDSIESGSTFRNNRLFNRAKNKGLFALEGIKKAIFQKTQQKAQEALNAYNQDPTTIGNVLETESAYLAQLNSFNPEKAKEHWESLAPEIQSQLKNIKLNSPSANSAYQSLLSSVASNTKTTDPLDASDNLNEVSNEDSDTPIDTTTDTSTTTTTLESDQKPGTTPDIKPTDVPKSSAKESPITGRGAHHWQDSNVNEVYVGGDGYKYPKGKLTRPGTAPTKWNDQEISSIKDTKGNQAIGKFYSTNGSEYVYTKEGTARKIKFNDPNTKGEDQGDQGWKQAYFLPKDHEIYKLFSELNTADRFLEFKNRHIDPKTGKLMIQDPKTGLDRPLMLSDLAPKDFDPEVVKKTGKIIKDHDFTFPASMGEPKVGNSIIELDVGENGEINGYHASEGIAHIEDKATSKQETSDDTQVESKPKKKKKKNNKKPIKDEAPTVASIIEQSNSFKEADIQHRDIVHVATPENFDGSIQIGLDIKSFDLFYVTPNGNFMLTSEDGETLKKLFEDAANNADLINELLGRVTNEFISAYAKALDETSKRDALALDEEVLAQKHKYLEDGQILDFDSDKVQSDFFRKFGDDIGKLFHVVSRPFHLWNNSKPASDILRSLLSDADKLMEHLRANKFTDADAIFKSLYTTNGKLNTRVDPESTYVFKNDTLANQIVIFLNPKGDYMQTFKEKFTERIQSSIKDDPLLAEFYGKALENKIDLLAVSGLQWLSALSSYAHNLTEDELKELGIDPELQGEDWNSFHEVMEQKAMQNLSTTIRKFLGVSFNGNATTESAENLINKIALDIAVTMVKAGMVERSSKEYIKSLKSDGDPEIESVHLLTPTSNYKGILRARSNILETLINPKMSHTWSSSPLEAKLTIAHSSDPVTTNIKKTVQRANNTPYFYNTTFGSFLTAIGGIDGYFALNGPRPTKANRHLFNFVDFVSKKGKEITKRLGFDLLNEVLVGTRGTRISDITIYFSNRAMKNSRVMQEGSATPQGNKLVRELFQALDTDEQDLTNQENRIKWNITLAQKLGVNVGKTAYQYYEKDILRALDFFNDVLIEPKYFDAINKILGSDASQVNSVKDTEETKATREVFLTIVNDFNKKFKDAGLAIKDDEGISAFLEMLKFAKASEEGTLDSFPSRIFIETDGIADGPTTLNSLFAKAIGRISPDAIKRMYMGGISLGIDIPVQDILSNVENEATKVIGTDGKDVHHLVANKYASQYVVARLVKLNEEINNNTSNAEQAIFAKKALKAGLTIWKAMGKVSGNIDSLMHISEMPENPSELLKFDLFVSKKGTTYSGYGAGSITNLRQQMQIGLRDMYSAMSESAQLLYAGKESPTIQSLKKFKKAITSEKVYVIDTETTAGDKGPDATKDQAVQVSIRVLNKGVLQKKVTTFWIKNDSSRSIPEKLGDKPNPTLAGYAKAEREGKLLSKEEAYRKINELIKDGKILGHNVRAFDSVLMNLNSNGLFDKADDDIIDTLELARDIFKYRSNKLEDLAKAENIKLDSEGKTHDASVDTELTAKLALDLLKNVDTKIKEASPIKTKKESVADINGVPLSHLMGAFKDLFELNYDYKNYYSKATESFNELSNKFSKSFGKKIPQNDELNERWEIDTKGDMFRRDENGKKVRPKDFRNFELNAVGLKHIVSVLNDVLGIPLHAAVGAALGSESIRAGRVTASIMGTANIVSQSEEFTYLGWDAENIGGMTYKELHDVQKTISKNNRVDLPGGATFKVQKLRKVESPLTVTDDETGISFSSLELMLTGASVSAGALGTQAAGDATTASRISQSAEGKFNYNPVFDGFYTTCDLMDTMSKIANMAYSYSLNQKVCTTLFHKLTSIGKRLSKEYYGSKLSPEEAIAEVITNLCKGLDASGEPINFPNEKVKAEFTEKITKEFFRYRESFFNSDSFVESLFEERDAKREGIRAGYAATTRDVLKNGTIKSAVSSTISELQRNLGAMSLIESVHNEVINKIPRRIQHMSGGPNGYVIGKPLTVAEAKSILSKVNSKGKTKFQNWSELMSAYISTKVNDLIKNEYSKKEAYKPYINDAIYALGLGRGNNIAKIINDKSSIDLLDQAFEFNKFKGPKFYPANPRTGFRSISVKEARSFLFNKSKSVNPMYKALFKKASINIPDDSEIVIVNDPDNLPGNLKSIWNSKVSDKANQTGLFTYENGKPVMIVISNTSDLSMTSLTQETILHECIHAVMARTLKQYSIDKKLPEGSKERKLNKDTFKAISNLEQLLEDFLIDYESGVLYNFPAEVQHLARILSSKQDPEERLDESLAYILSKNELFNALSTYHPRNASAHFKRAYRLLKKVQVAAKYAWKKILNIVTGSPMDKVLEWQDVKKQFQTMSDDFITTYGMNTMVVMNAIDKYSGDDNRFSKDVINSDISRASVTFRGSSPFYLRATKNFNEALAHKVMGYSTFKEYAKGHPEKIIGPSDNFLSDYGQEQKKIKKYTKSVRNTLRNLVAHPKEVAETVTYLRNPHIFTQEDKYKLTVAKNAALAQLSSSSFVEDPSSATAEDLEASKRLFDLLNGTVSLADLSPEDRSEFLQPKFEQTALFYALALKDPIVQKVLSNLKLKFDTKSSPKKFTEIFNNWAEDKANEWKKESLNNRTPIEIFDMALENNLKDLNAKDTFYEKLEKKVDHVTSGISAGIIQGLEKTRVISKKQAQKLLNYSGDPIFIDSTIKESLRHFINKKVNPTIASFTKEIYGRVPSNTEEEVFLKSIKGFFDKDRLKNLKELPERLLKAFSSNISKKDKSFLHRTIARTDLICFDFQEIKSLIEDPKKMTQAVSALEEKIETYSDEGHGYISKAKQLADYISGSRKPGHNLLTNAVAIARNLGSNSPLLHIAEDSEIVTNIDKLTSLYAIQNLSKNDRKKLANYFLNDSKGVEETYNQLKDAFREEAIRTKDQKQFIHNRLKGWLPKGSQPTGLYRIVPRSEAKHWRSKGYKILGNYKASNLDTSEPMIRVYSSYPQDQSFQEGLLQGINSTYYGYQYQNGTRGEAIGTRIADAGVASKIASKYHSEGEGNEVIPLYNSQGKFIGFERSIPPQDRYYIEQDNDIFSGVAQFRAHQARESLAKVFNDLSIELAKKQWDNAKDSEKKEFIDVFHSKDIAIKRALARLNPDDIKKIKEVFGGDHFYVKKDVLWTYIGYERSSITDIWDGKFFIPKEAQKVIADTLDLFVPNGKARYYLSNFEKMWMGLVGFTRDTIIIRSGVVPLFNALANIFVLHLTLGIPLNKIYQLYKENLIHTKTYERLSKEIRQLEYDLANTKNIKEENEIKDKINKLTSECQSLPIYRLLKEGEYATISDEGTTYDEIEITKQKLDDVLNSATDKMPKFGYIRKGTREVLMLKGSHSYNALLEFTNLGDWLAKATAYRYLTEGKQRMSHDVARNISSILFVDFDQFVGRERDWTNRVGLTWFMTYKYRMIPAALLAVLLNPSRVILGTAFSSMFNFLGTPLTEMLPTKILTGDIAYSVGIDSIFRGLAMYPSYTLVNSLVR